MVVQRVVWAAMSMMKDRTALAEVALVELQASVVAHVLSFRRRLHVADCAYVSVVCPARTNRTLRRRLYVCGLLPILLRPLSPPVLLRDAHAGVAQVPAACQVAQTPVAILVFVQGLQPRDLQKLP